MIKRVRKTLFEGTIRTYPFVPMQNKEFITFTPSIEVAHCTVARLAVERFLQNYFAVERNHLAIGVS